MTTWRVYKMYGRRGTLLYVGCSKDVDTRLSGHSYQSPWYKDVTSVEVSRPFKSKRNAGIREAMTIALGKPRYNLHYQVPFRHSAAQLAAYKANSDAAVQRTLAFYARQDAIRDSKR